MSFSLLWLVSYEFLTGKGDMCSKIVKEKYFTFVRLEMQNSYRCCAVKTSLLHFLPKQLFGNAGIPAIQHTFSQILVPLCQLEPPLVLELRAFRQYFCIVCIVPLKRYYVFMHFKHLNVVSREKNVSKCYNSSDLVERWYEFSSVRLE